MPAALTQPLARHFHISWGGGHKKTKKEKKKKKEKKRRRGRKKRHEHSSYFPHTYTLQAKSIIEQNK